MTTKENYTQIFCTPLDDIYHASSRFIFFFVITAVEALNNNLGFLLEDKESVTNDIQVKYLTIMKMLLYVYVKMVVLLESFKEKQRMVAIPMKGRNKKQSEEEEGLFFGYNPLDVILKITNIIQREINFFWDPPVVEDTFVG